MPNLEFGILIVVVATAAWLSNRNINKQLNKIMTTIDEIQADVTDETTVIDGVVTLLNNLSALLAAAGTDPVKLQALKDSIDANKAKLAAAVAANTPAATPAPAKPAA